MPMKTNTDDTPPRADKPSSGGVANMDVTMDPRNDTHDAHLDAHQQVGYLQAAFQTLTNLTAEPVLLVDSGGVVQFVNDAACRFLHQPAETLVGGPVPFNPAGEDGIASFTDTHGQVIPFTIATATVPGPEGDETLLILRQPSASAGRATRGEQNATMDALSRLTAKVAHDFNNQLTVISGFSSLADKQLDGEHPARESLSEIARAADRSSQMISQLMTFSRKQKLNPKVISADDLLRAARPALERLVPSFLKIDFTFGAQDATLRVDPIQLEELLANFTTNARDAMGEGGQISIATDTVVIGSHPALSAGPHVVFRVTDTGCGMDSETLSHIFEPFFTTKAKGKGTGLGLATAYGFVLQSGGHIEVDSSVGAGTTFTLYFPQVDAPVEATSEPAATNEPTVSGKGTVLVAEDEGPVRTLLSRVLKAAGYHVLDAEDGPQALTLSEGHAGEIDLLVTDIVMPGMNGRVLAKRVLADRPDTKVMYISGYSGGVAKADDIAAEGATFIRKPFSPDSLLSAVKTMIPS
jgi:two-component system cell cycle sensor histidine kinase/response regulator CckA